MKLVVTGSDVSSSDQAMNLAEQYRMIFSCLPSFHPAVDPMP